MENENMSEREMDTPILPEHLHFQNEGSLHHHPRIKEFADLHHTGSAAVSYLLSQYCDGFTEMGIRDILERYGETKWEDILSFIKKTLFSVQFRHGGNYADLVRARKNLRNPILTTYQNHFFLVDSAERTHISLFHPLDWTTFMVPAHTFCAHWFGGGESQGYLFLLPYSIYHPRNVEGVLSPAAPRKNSFNE
jgi:hypothetical protein